MHDSGGEHVTWLFWQLSTPPYRHQGSMFFIDCERGPFAITAGHVFQQFVEDRAERRVLGCQIGNVAFDPEQRLIAWGRGLGLDVATFRVTPDEIAATGKRIVPGIDGVWPPPPNKGEAVYFGGFPASERDLIVAGEFAFGLHSAMVPLTDFTERQPVYRDGAWGWRLVGVLSEAVMARDFERVTAEWAHFILPDGRLSR